MMAPVCPLHWVNRYRNKQEVQLCPLLCQMRK
jgi:hypothetical protein